MFAVNADSRPTGQTCVEFAATLHCPVSFYAYSNEFGASIDACAVEPLIFDVASWVNTRRGALLDEAYSDARAQGAASPSTEALYIKLRS